jgi:hypothetical protein
MREWLIVRSPANSPDEIIGSVEADSRAGAMAGQEEGNIFVSYYAVTPAEWRSIMEAQS